MVLFRLERKTVLMLIKPKRHSVALVASWSLLLLIELVVIASWNSPDWWFARSSNGEEVRLLWLFVKTMLNLFQQIHVQYVWRCRSHEHSRLVY